MKTTAQDDSKRDDQTQESFWQRNSEWLWLAVLIVLTVVGFPILILFMTEKHSSRGGFYKYEVLGVIDGRTLKVNLLDQEKGVHAEGNEMQLMGVWSDKNQESDIIYQNRLQFLQQQVVGKTIQGQAHLKVVDPNPPEPPEGYNQNSPFHSDQYRPKRPVEYFRTPQKPAEVRLEDGTSLNELLLVNGYAAFDFSDRFLAEDDQARYLAAEAQARAAQRGIWSSAESARKYTSLKELFEHKERLKRAGLGFYFLTQIVLISVTLMLMWASQKFYGKESFIAASKLLVIPGLLLLVILLRFFLTNAFPNEDSPDALKLYFFYLLVVIAACVWAAIQFVTIVREGPLREWQTLWKSSQAVEAIWIFLIGLAGLTILFGLLFRFAGGMSSLLASLQVSFSQTLNLGYPVPQTAAVQKVATAQSYLLWAWVILCGFFGVSPRAEGSTTLSLRNAIFKSLSSLAVLVLVVASVFANIFYYNIHFNWFNRPLDLGECFLLAMLPFIKKSYSGVYPTSAWMVVLQSLEVCLVMLLQLVAWKFIFASVKNANDARHARRAAHST
jgi:hypothetical protein